MTEPADDVTSARKMQIETKQRTPAVIAFAVVAGWLAMEAALMVINVPEGNRDLVIRALGVLDINLGMIIGFYFGSSSSSRQKDDTIKSLSQ